METIVLKLTKVQMAARSGGKRNEMLITATTKILRHPQNSVNTSHT